MKVIKRYILYILAVILSIQCERDEPNPTVNITDNNFLNALIESGIDTDGDGMISATEASPVAILAVSDCDISDLNGIENFTCLARLNCSENKLTHLDVSNNIALVDLNCICNQLAILDVSNNTSLEELYCSENLLSTLDVSNMVGYCNLYCSGNQLTTIDVSNNTSLRDLDCSENQLTSLDVSNNTALGVLYLGNMPSLGKVCVWEVPFPPEGVEIDTEGSPNVYFTTDCSK